MNSVGFENQILDAIETIATKTINEAGYDKTIRGVIIEGTDASIGKYKVKYQDSEIEAYSNNTEILYPEGTLVNILVPNGDFSQTKVILDAVEKEKIVYTSVLEEEDKYSNNSGNVINNRNEEFGLCSYKALDKKVLYDVINNINLIDLDDIKFDEYIKENSSILCAVKTRTELASEQQSNGNFGLGVVITFKDNYTGNYFDKEYILDINSMQGTPYNQKFYNRQYKIFGIENENYIRLKNVYIFSQDFPNIINDKPNDIFFKDLELCAVDRIPDDQLNQYSLSFEKSGKGYFTDDVYEDSDINVTANVLYKNKTIPSDVEYYWFKENTKIKAGRAGYSVYGGEGWECVNNFESYGANNTQRQYFTDSNIITIHKADVLNRRLKMKCVAVKNDNVLVSRDFSIMNYGSQLQINIMSDDGTQFYFDNGNPTLTCVVSPDDNNYVYYWGVIDSNGDYTELEETTAENEEYNDALEDYNNLIAEIEIGTALPVASQEQLDNDLTIIESYDKIQRVEGKYLHKIDLTQIKDNSTFYCSVFYKEQDNSETFMGTAAIEIRNSAAIEGQYTLNILNGNQTYIYNEFGTSPVNINSAENSIFNTLKIKPLSFEIIDNLGNRLNQALLEQCDIEWIIPSGDTSLIIDTQESVNHLQLNYNLARKYDVMKDNNIIKLKVNYKNLSLDAYTNFNFLKEGEPGTNGTEVVCKIVPNIANPDSFEEYPAIENGVLNFTPLVANKWFKVQLWKNGDKIFEDYQNGNTTDDNASVSIKWEILKNKYTSSISDPSAITILNNNFSYSNYNSNAANIVKVNVSYKGKNYYNTLPIITTNITDNNYTTVKLLKNTGFRYVMYASDGTKPLYDNIHPFEIQVKKMIDEYEEDVSNINNIDYRMSYVWNIKGRLYYGDAWHEDAHLEIKTDSLLSNNKKFLIPNEEFDGDCVTNAIEVTIKRLTTTIATIHIPIHFYLNKYGNAALNDWDGNKITLNDDLGSILAPQVGAGSKNSSNQFSGVLMGSVKSSNSNTIERGLFGYYNGERSIFLNSDNGKATFGLAGSGQIIIDPTQNKKALIYGGNYIDGASGMLIDLTTPEIKWGNGKFSVTSSGELTATNVDLNGKITAEEGKIGGFVISEYNLKGTNVGMSSESGHDWAFWAGASTGEDAPFHVGHDGTLVATSATINGKITSIDGSIGGWTIGNNSLHTSSNDLYLGNSGITATIGGTSRNNIVFKAASNFGVDSSGNLYANNANLTGATVSGNITATTLTATQSGYLSGWTFNSNNFYWSGSNAKDGFGLYMHKNHDPNTHSGIAMNIGGNQQNIGGSAFKVYHDGTLYATNANITGSISSSTISGSTITGGSIEIKSADGIWTYFSAGGNVTSSYSLVLGSEGDWLSSSFYTPGGIRVGKSILSDSGWSINTAAQLTCSTINANGGWSINSTGTMTGPGGAKIFGNSNCALQPASRSYAYVGSTGSTGNRIATSSSGPSSKNVKINLDKLTKEEYLNLYNDLHNIYGYNYDYKYKEVNGELEKDYGFIIDEIDNSKYLSKYFRNYKVTRWIDSKNNRLLKQNFDDEDMSQYQSIEVKEWERDAYIKGLFILIKALQNKIDDLENQLNQMKEGK